MYRIAIKELIKWKLNENTHVSHFSFAPLGAKYR